MMALAFKFTPRPIAMPRRSQEATRGSVRLSTARPEETSSNGSARAHVLAAPNIRYTIAIQHTALGHSPRTRPTANPTSTKLAIAPHAPAIFEVMMLAPNNFIVRPLRRKSIGPYGNPYNPALSGSG